MIEKLAEALRANIEARRKGCLPADIERRIYYTYCRETTFFVIRERDGRTSIQYHFGLKHTMPAGWLEERFHEFIEVPSVSGGHYDPRDRR